MTPNIPFGFKNLLLKLSHQIPAAKPWKATGQSACIERAQAGRLNPGCSTSRVWKMSVTAWEEGPFLSCWGSRDLSPLRTPVGGRGGTIPQLAGAVARHLTRRVSCNENTARRLFILGRAWLSVHSRPGTGPS